MNRDPILATIAGQVARATGGPAPEPVATPVGGGCINEALVLGAAGRRCFVKLNRADRLQMFEAEAAGLEALAATGTLRVPRPLAVGTVADRAFLAMEYLDLGGRADPARLGEGLAALHRHTAGRFGFDRDNTIGATPQPNPWTADWIKFWREQRLGHQLRLAARRGLGRRALDLGERLAADLDRFFAGYTPAPSLLHGDLWGGNADATRSGEPVIYDPACYYGDREADLAMTELFGGFGPRFHDAYDAVWPRDPGYGVRRDLYNLYHVLNHYNLFGGGYASQAESMMARLVSETG